MTTPDRTLFVQMTHLRLPLGKCKEAFWQAMMITGMPLGGVLAAPAGKKIKLHVAERRTDADDGLIKSLLDIPLQADHPPKNMENVLEMMSFTIQFVDDISDESPANTFADMIIHVYFKQTSAACYIANLNLARFSSKGFDDIFEVCSGILSTIETTLRLSYKAHFPFPMAACEDGCKWVRDIVFDQEEEIFRRQAADAASPAADGSWHDALFEYQASIRGSKRASSRTRLALKKVTSIAADVMTTTQVVPTAPAPACCLKHETQFAKSQARQHFIARCHTQIFADVLVSLREGMNVPWDQLEDDEKERFIMTFANGDKTTPKRHKEFYAELVRLIFKAAGEPIPAFRKVGGEVVPSHIPSQIGVKRPRDEEKA